MSAKIIKGSTELGNKIRQRRNELNFTIEEAAAKAGVGTKTWSRYEAGESIRRDKAASICKTLNWKILPGQNETEEQEVESFINRCRNSNAWPKALADTFGEAAAISFVIGSDILLDHIEEDLESLSGKPKGTHIGELDLSWIKDSLPPQFIVQYDYDFLYYLKSVLVCYRNQAAGKKDFIAHTVTEELILYLIMEESKFLMESIIPYLKPSDEEDYCDWDSWPFDLFDDMDVTCLYAEYYLESEHPYHFGHWREQQFYCGSQPG